MPFPLILYQHSLVQIFSSAPSPQVVFSLYSSPNVRDWFSLPYKCTGKIMIIGDERDIMKRLQSLHSVISALEIFFLSMDFLK